MSTTEARPISQATIDAIIREWHEQRRAEFTRYAPSLDYDGPHYYHHATEKKVYICLDRGTGGHYLIDKRDGRVWGISAYGVPNRRHYYGNVHEDSPAVIAARFGRF